MFPGEEISGENKVLDLRNAAKKSSSFYNRLKEVAKREVWLSPNLQIAKRSMACDLPSIDEANRFPD